MIERVRAQVASREPVDDREAESIREFLREFDRLTRPFDEDADSVHVTASAVVVGPHGVLLHLHKRLGMWLQPGGHIDEGESPPLAAWREAIEETGLTPGRPDDDQPLLHVDVHGGGRGHRHLDLRYLFEVDGEPAPPEGESQDVRWFAWPDALAIADPGLSGVLRWLTAGLA